MTAYHADPSVQGAKTARMEQRTTPEAKELIEKAASLLGINPSEFMLSAAAKIARETVRDYEMTILSPSSHAAFRQALDGAEPSAKLIDLMKLHAEASAEK
jgi:uncharacterized protein (DUF1778 family)